MRYRQHLYKNKIFDKSGHIIKLHYIDEIVLIYYNFKL